MPEMASITNGALCYHQNSPLRAYRNVCSESPPLSPPPTSPLPPLPASLPFQNLSISASSNCIKRPRRAFHQDAGSRTQLQAIVSSDRLQRRLLPYSIESDDELGARSHCSPVHEIRPFPCANLSQLPNPQSLIHNPLAAFTFTEEVLTALPDYFESVIYAKHQIQTSGASTKVTEHQFRSPQRFYHLPPLMELKTRQVGRASKNPTAVPALQNICNPHDYNPQLYRDGRGASNSVNAKDLAFSLPLHCPSRFTQKHSPQGRPHLQTWNPHSGQPSKPKRTVTITNLTLRLGQSQDPQLQIHDFDMVSVVNTYCRPQTEHEIPPLPRMYKGRIGDGSTEHRSPSRQTPTNGTSLPKSSSKRLIRSSGHQHIANSTTCHEQYTIPHHSPSRTATKSANTEHNHKREECGPRLERISNPEAEELDEDVAIVVRSRKSKILWAIATVLLVLVAAAGILAGIIWRLKTLDRDS